MKKAGLLLTAVVIWVSTLGVQAQSQADSSRSLEAKKTQKKYQARAPKTQPFGADAFAPSTQTTLRWLGMAGFLINSRGTTLMVDPLLEGFDMPIMIDFPIVPKDVPRLDAVLVTHADNDHFSVPTNRDLKAIIRVYHSTVYVDSLMKNLGLPSFGHDIGDMFAVGPVRVKLTPADHAYQNAYPGMSNRRFKNEDACGFWIQTPDGNIWATGDSRLTPGHLTMPTPDAILFDFSDSERSAAAVALYLRGGGKIGECLPQHPAFAVSLGVGRFAGFRSLQRRSRKAGETGYESGAYSGTRTGATVYP